MTKIASKKLSRRRKPMLISPLHDPGGQYLLIIKKWASFLLDFYTQVVLGISQETNPKVLIKLKNLGFIILQGEYPYGEAHRQALAWAFKKDGEIFHFSDFDRILHWVSSYPKELQKTLKKAHIADYIILGRIKRALDTHPLSWQLTEKSYNTLLSKTLGMNVDVGTGAAILNQRAAKTILAKSKETGFSILAEWPLLVKKAGLKVSYLAVEGYEWENPDRFQKEIKKIGYQKWIKRYNSPEEWRKRLKITDSMVETVSRLVF